ncbi:hypothetical protein D3C80_1768550 [compost metagenome]
MRGRLLKSLDAIRCGDDLVSGQFQAGLDDLANTRFIVDDENLFLIHCDPSLPVGLKSKRLGVFLH